MTRQEDRAYWVSLADRLAGKILPALATGRLRATMPVETLPVPEAADRPAFSHLEAFARLLLGLAPWLELEAPLEAPERTLQDRYRGLALQAMDRALDPQSPDCLDFNAGPQSLVDAALLASALLRAPKALGAAIQGQTRQRLIQALRSTRAITPYPNNWLLFSAMVEAGLAALGADWQADPIETALQKHEAWYLGDGNYGDGPGHHWDYYNSFVIHPLTVELLDAMRPFSGQWAALREPVLIRARRYAEIQERMISPEGSYPALGRSITYRAGAFHLLAYLSLRQDLPASLQPAQVRGALSAVLRRQMEMPGTFDAQGWLTLGFAGHQPELAEFYVSTGSLYMVSAALLPLGLSPQAPFWSGPDLPWTAKILWQGGSASRDQSLEHN